MSNRNNRTKLVVRVIALILAALMVGGTVYSLIYMFTLPSYAASYAQDDVYLRVGLMYGNGVEVGFETTAPNGYLVGVQSQTDDNYLFKPITHLSTSTVSVVVDANLSKSNNTYAIASASSAVVGGYHVEFSADIAIYDDAALQTMLDSLNASLSSHGLYAFPVYVNGVIRVRVGSFVSKSDAELMYPFIAGFMGYIESHIVAPSETCVSVLDPSTNRILWEYECSDGTSLGLRAYSPADETAYIKTPANNVYDGVFAYNRYADEGYVGVSVTNVLTLDQYVEGVLPYEISPTWPAEAQKAFAIAARSYAAYQLELHRHSNYYFDLCNGTHCQTYRGAGRVNQNVIDAVQATHGMIILADGKIASAFYSSSHGGYTVSIEDIWGGAASSYLVAHATPWERYMEHSNGFWTAEVSPYELLQYLREKGYTELTGSISSIETVEYAKDSTYVYKLKIADTNGHSIVITNTDKVRTALSAYVKSANFVVGKGQVTYTEDTVTHLNEVMLDTTVQTNVLPPVTSADQIKTPLPDIWHILTSVDSFSAFFEQLKVLTSNNIVSPNESVSVLTANGLVSFDGRIASGSSGLLGAQMVKEYMVTTETKTYTAATAGNFVFVGKGWGHGGGMSQYGTKDLADLGYDYRAIINAYFTDVEIVHYMALAER